MKPPPLFIILAAILLSTTTRAQTIKAVSFNIRYDNPDDGINQWKNRREGLALQVLNERPDVIGMQEALWSQIRWLDSTFAGYNREGVGRDDGINAGEFSPIYYSKTRFERIAGGTFWLSTTSGEPSKGWDAALNRICTWVRLKEVTTGKIFLAFNTHFDHIGEIARINSARLVADSIADMSKGVVPAILSGDFNAEPGSVPIEWLSKMLTDTRPVTTASNQVPPTPTFNGWNAAEHTECIDFIFCNRGSKPLDYKVFNQPGNYLSDHFMVMAIIELNKGE